MATGINMFDGNGDFLSNLAAVEGSADVVEVDAPGTPGGNVLRVDFTNGLTYNILEFAATPESPVYEFAALVNRPDADDHIAGVGLIDSIGEAVIAGLRNNPTDATVRLWNDALNTLDNYPHGATLPAWMWIKVTYADSIMTVQVWPADMAADDFGAQAAPSPRSYTVVANSNVSPVLAFVLTSSADRSIDIAYLSYGTDGDAAPLPGDVVEEPAPEECTCVDGDPGPAPQMRTEGDIVQWKHENKTSWTNLFQVPAGGASTAKRASLTTEEFGIAPTGDPVLDTANFQDFIDATAADGIIAYVMPGQWELEHKLNLRNGSRIIGAAMDRTIFNCNPDWWTGSDFDVFKMDESISNDVITEWGFVLSDFTIIGADRLATRNGNNIRTQAVQNFEIARIHSLHGSDACIRTSGYGGGDYVNDASHPSFNNAFRGHVHHCHTEGGYLGIETPGGIENLWVDSNVVDGAEAHGIRFSVPWESHCINNTVKNCGKTSIWVNRHRRNFIMGNNLSGDNIGITWAGFRDTDTGMGDSTDLIISNNRVECTQGGTGMTDAYHGTSTHDTDGVSINNNLMVDADIQLYYTKNAFITGNTRRRGGVIDTNGYATGVVANNMMPLSNSAAGVVDGGGNIGI